MLYHVTAYLLNDAHTFMAHNPGVADTFATICRWSFSAIMDVSVAYASGYHADKELVALKTPS